MKFLIVFYFVLIIKFILSLNNNLLIEQIHCNEILKTAINIKQNYFADEHDVTLVDFADDNINVSDGCEVDFYQQVELFKDIKKIQFKSTSSSPLFAYPTTKGFALKGSYEKTLKFIVILSKFNPQLKVLALLSNGNLESVKNLMKIGFEKFKMLNIAVILYTENDQLFCMRNPFSGNSKKRKPELKCWNLKHENPNLKIQIKNFMKNRIENLHKYPLNIDVYKHEIGCMPVVNENGEVIGLTYTNGELLNTLVKKMNFHPIYIFPQSTNETTGHQLSNGTWTASTGNLENDELNIAYSVVPKIMGDFRTKNSLFLHTVSSVKFRFIIRKKLNQKKINFENFYNFDDWTKYFIALTIILIPTVLIIINKLESKLLKKKSNSIIDHLLLIFGIFLNVSRKIPTLSSTRLIIFVILFSNLMFLSIFQGTMTRELNTFDTKNKILTIDQLIEEGYELMMPLNQRDLFLHQGGAHISEILKNVAIKCVKTPSIDSFTDGIEYVAKEKHKKVAMLSIDVFTKNYLSKYYDNETGEEILEIIPEIAYETFSAPRSRKDSPFIKIFNKLISVYLESGVFDHDLNLKINEANVIMERNVLRVKNDFEKKLIKMKDLLDIFELYGILLSCAALVFIFEIIFDWIMKKI